jgi:hypothetical protein
VGIQAAADRPHQEEVDRLVEARRAADEEVANRAQGAHDLDLEPRLLTRLAERGLLGCLAGIGRALGQGPQQRSPAMNEGDLELSVVKPMDDAAGRGRARGAQDRHARR